METFCSVGTFRRSIQDVLYMTSVHIYNLINTTVMNISTTKVTTLPGYKERSEKPDDEERNASYKDICDKFAEKTSMQAIPYIHNSKSKSGKAAWSIIYLMATAGLLFHLYYLFTVYFNYPKKTKVILGFDTLPFPAITICNVNPIRQSMVHLLKEDLQKLLNNSLPGARMEDKNNNDGEELNSNETKELDALFNDSEQEHIGIRDESAEIYDNFLFYFNTEEREKRLQVGHQLKNMLIKCTFSGRSCLNQSFIQISNPYFGNCYSLQTKRFRTSRSGQYKGLELILYLENDEYLKGITTSHGAQLLIHDPDILPHPDSHGIAVPTASQTFIGLKMVRIDRLGAPFGKCTDSTPFKATYGINYSISECQNICEARKIMDVCNCSDPFHEETNMKIKNARQIPENCKEIKDHECILQIQKSFKKHFDECVCYNPCSEIQYEKSLSNRPWPSSDHAKFLLQSYCETNVGHRCVVGQQGDSDQAELLKNFVKLNIYYDDLNYQNITEVQEYADAQFASDIGGTLGLWIGLSLLSIFELAQFFKDLIDVSLKKLLRT